MDKNYVLGGWAEKLKSPILPNSRFLVYRKSSNYQEFSRRIKKQKCNALIGWSLGAQIAIRLASEDIIRPRLLVLIAPPFQFISSKKYPCSISKVAFKCFKIILEASPKQTLMRFAKLSNNLAMAQMDLANISSWMPWLKELGDFSCDHIDFSNFPKTLIIHGNKDRIVSHKQSQLLNKLIPDSNLHIFKDCGHAPHMHNKTKFDLLIKEHLECKFSNKIDRVVEKNRKNC
jgi:pimeloyl-[acyl-carrier protein] methyl ester esterase